MADIVEIKNSVDCKSKEWIDGFNSKYEILKSHFKESFQEDLYTDMHGDLGAKCNMIVDKDLKRNRISFESLMGYIEEHDTVFIYPQTFDYMCEGKPHVRTYEALKSLKCFVIDIDYVTPDIIMTVINKIGSMDIKPNYIVNSGGGLHLYFIFSVEHNVKASVGLMSYYDEKLNVVKCLTHNILYQGCYRKLLGKYSEIKKGMALWFSETPADTNNHLTQPIRLFGSKTKNPEYYTQIFKVSDEKYTIQQIAETFNIDLPEEEDIVQFDKFSKRSKNKNRYAKKKERRLLESTPLPTTEILYEMIYTPQDYHFNFDEFERKIRSEELEQLSSAENIYYQNRESDREKIRSKLLFSSVQAKGKESMYLQFKDLIWNAGRVGNRRNCLYVFYHRAHLYTHDEARIKSDYVAMSQHFNKLSNTDKLTDKQINSIPLMDVIKIKDQTIYNLTGIIVKFIQKKKEARIATKKKNQLKKDDKFKTIIGVVNNNPDLSYTELSKTLASMGIKYSRSSLCNNQIIKEIKNNTTITGN